MKCSFCSKPQDEVNALIVGPQVNICDKCVIVCIEIILKNYQAIFAENDDLHNIIHLMETL